MKSKLLLVLHAAGAAAAGGAMSYLYQALSGGVSFDSAHLHSYAQGMASAAIISILAYFMKSPLSAVKPADAPKQ